MLLSYSDNRTTPEPCSDWRTRVLLMLLAAGGTLAYAASFQGLAGRALPQHVAHTAACVGIAAGLAWPVFGAALLLVTGGRPSALHWADACLRAMAAGLVVLGFAAVINLDVRLVGVPAAIRRWLPAFHAALLVAANALMCGVFVGEARRLHVPPLAAMTLWMLALNGTFAAILFVLYRNGVM